MDKNSKTVGIGIIGCGKRMADFLETLKYLDNNHQCEILAINDLNGDAIKKFKNSFGENVKVYASSDELVKDPNISWVFIGSYNKFHKEHIMCALKANKNVFCEKPLAINLEECIEIKKLLKSKKLHLVIGYVLRYSPHYLKIKELIDSGKIGKIVSLEFNETIPPMHGAFFMTNWRRFVDKSGGFLIEKCCHDIDLANWLVNSIPRKVASFGGLTTFRPENSYILKKLEKENLMRIRRKEKVPPHYTWNEDPFKTEKEIVDHQVAIIKYFNHVCATFHTNCTATIPERRMYITGTEGTIRADLLVGKIEVKTLGEEKIEIITQQPIKIEREQYLDSHGGGDRFLAESLRKTMTHGDDSPVPIDEAIKSAISSFAIEQALRTSKTIMLENFWYKLGEIPKISVKKAQKTDSLKDVKINKTI